MAKLRLPKGASTPSVADFAVGGPLIAKAEEGGISFLREVLKIIRDYKKDPNAIALAERVTPARVFHRTPINAPKGFEFPEGFGSPYPDRPAWMGDRFIAQRTLDEMAQNNVRNSKWIARVRGGRR